VAALPGSVGLITVTHCDGHGCDLTVQIGRAFFGDEPRQGIHPGVPAARRGDRDRAEIPLARCPARSDGDLSGRTSGLTGARSPADPAVTDSASRP
jgi:hypothetical protein